MKVTASKDTKKKKKRELLQEKQKSPLTFEIRQILATLVNNCITEVLVIFSWSY